jgi:hypothetical protein
MMGRAKSSVGERKKVGDEPEAIGRPRSTLARLLMGVGAAEKAW